jgi:hypothetical protein
VQIAEHNNEINKAQTTRQQKQQHNENSKVQVIKQQGVRARTTRQ